jgi:hypothetical protein
MRERQTEREKEREQKRKKDRQRDPVTSVFFNKKEALPPKKISRPKKKCPTSRTQDRCPVALLPGLTSKLARSDA